MVREVGKARVRVGRRRCGFEELGDRAVQTHPLERHELGEQHLADERVREPEPVEPARLLHDEAGLARLDDRVDEVGAAHLLDEREVERRPDHRGDRERVVRGVRQPGESAPGRLAHAFGQGAGLPRAARVLDVTHHLDQEERVPRRHLGELAPEGAVGVADGREVRVDVGRRETAERDAMRVGVAAQVGERRGERMRARELGVAIRADDEQPGVPSSRARGGAAATASSCPPSGGRRGPAGPAPRPMRRGGAG